MRCIALRALAAGVFSSLSLLMMWCNTVHCVNCLLFLPATSLAGDSLRHLNRVTIFLTEKIVLSICLSLPPPVHLVFDAQCLHFDPLLLPYWSPEMRRAPTSMAARPAHF